MKTLHKIYAKLTGSFWTTCPKCNQYFGKHQGISHFAEVKSNHGKVERFRYICGRCLSKIKNEVL